MADTAVAEKKETLPTTIMADMAAFAGEGMDSIGTEDMQIPFFTGIASTVARDPEERPQVY
jgi:hypothetical protein